MAVVALVVALCALVGVSAASAFHSAESPVVENLQPALSTTRSSSASGENEPAALLLGASQAIETLSASEEPVLFDALTGIERTLTAPEAQGIETALDAFRAAGRNVGFVVFDLAERRGLGYNVDATFFSASTVKAPFVASVVQGAVDVGAVSMDDEMVERTVSEGTGIMAHDGIDRYNLETVLANTLVHSDNTGYALLRERFGAETFEAWCAQAGVDAASWNGAWYPNYSVRDLAELWVSIGSYLVKGEGSAGWLADQLSATSASFLREALGDRGRVLSKPGYEMASAAVDTGALNDAGVVLSESGAYVIAIMSDADYDDESFTDNEHLIVDLAKALGDARDQVLAVRSVA